MSANPDENHSTARIKGRVCSFVWEDGVAATRLHGGGAQGLGSNLRDLPSQNSNSPHLTNHCKGSHLGLRLWALATISTIPSKKQRLATNRQNYERPPTTFCPANWRLPLSDSTYNETPGSFYYLLNQYGLTSSSTSGNNNITTSPLYFVRSGYVTPGNYLVYAGRGGYYWSGRARSSGGAYFLYFTSSSVLPYYGSNRYDGYSVRCVAGWE